LTGFEDMSLGELLDALGSVSGAPGGGSAAAVAVALAAAVVELAARASGDEWDEAGGALAQATALRLRSMRLSAQDADAYNAARQALRRAAAGAGGSGRLSDALSTAAEIPLAIAEAGADTAELARNVAEHADPDLRADAMVAALLAGAAARGASRLVEINLATTSGDPRAARAGELALAANAAVQRALAVE
jgi:formiminotetrahydrofolate cyclodeaminase